ncbi:hypothetical protein RND71_028576 [Anisodus tanguticus]|uniref:Uncharacterized protein n=1 Tax=Anisodus tanguticus TaxID=243964 RepID=A0AAE1RLH9_9SOLA|nr:hypothetical protein RND71_028576 [Anisodus tanguticus]
MRSSGCVLHPAIIEAMPPSTNPFTPPPMIIKICSKQSFLFLDEIIHLDSFLLLFF